MTSTEQKPCIIIDNGTGYIKAGFSGTDMPATNFASVVGRPKTQGIMVGTSTQEFYVGGQALEKKGVLKLSYPVAHGVVESWDDMEKIWQYCFASELRVDPSEYNVLLTEAPLNPLKNREKMTEIMFSNFNVTGMYIAIQAVLSLYSAGKFTGIVYDSGDGVTHLVPIYDGYALPHSVKRMNLAGRDLTAYLQKLLLERGIKLDSSAEFEIVKDIKEKLGYVALDFKEEMAKYNSGGIGERSFEMPDGSVINVGNEVFRCNEALFQPSLIGKEFDGADKLTFESIKSAEIDVRKDLYENIVLSGGSTLITGLPERLTKEVKALAPQNMSSRVKVYNPVDRKYSVFLGGSVLASIPSFNQMWITREEFQEQGPSIVHRKCMT